MLVALDEATTVPQLLSVTARAIVERLDAQACTISRAIGDLLVDLVDYTPTGTGVQVGHGYLISDYPETRAVLERLEPQIVFARDQEADAQEVALLRELGFDSLLMLPVEVNGTAWGLVEVYDNTTDGFTDVHLAEARRIIDRAGETLAKLGRAA
jgi:transcriptional regulator with GAF, ATPase, and Fis domain